MSHLQLSLFPATFYDDILRTTDLSDFSYLSVFIKVFILFRKFTV